MIVFDAGVLIGLLDPDDIFHEPVLEFIDENEHDEFVATVLTVTEALVRPAAIGAAERLKAGFTRLGLLQVETTDEDIVPLAELRASTRLRMPDALVLHTAQRVGGELVTTDAALSRAADARGVTAHLLTAP